MTHVIRLDEKVIPDDDPIMDTISGMMLKEPTAGSLILKEDADVYKPDGTLLLRYRRNILPHDVVEAAYPCMHKASETVTNNRGYAAGVFTNEEVEVGDVASGIKVRNRTRLRFHRGLEGGGVSKTTLAKPVRSAIIGNFDRYTTRFPYCRTTAFSLQEPELFTAAIPYIQHVGQVFKNLAPDRYENQMRYVDQTDPNWVIHGTPFTTVTVNKNWQTAVHKDKGDLEEGFGVLSAFSAGSYDGCYFFYPQFGVGVDLRTADVVLADVHEWHGNTPINPSGWFQRVSCVFYYRKKMIECGTPEEEYQRALSVQTELDSKALWEKREREAAE